MTITAGPGRVLVTGATGAVGPRIVRELLGDGWAVRVLAREARPGVLPDGTEIVSGDITNSTVVDRSVAGIDAVVHLAALLHITSPGPSLVERYREVNVEGTRRLVAAAYRAGVSRFVYLSTIAVYGNTGGQVVDEKTTPRPENIYAETKLAGERIVMDAAPSATVLRAAAVYGSRVRGNYRQLVTALASGWYVPVGTGTNRRTLIYDRDLAAAVRLALRHPAAVGRLLNVTDGSLHRLEAIVAAIASALGRRPPRLTVPVGPVRAALTIADAAARAFARSPGLRDRFEKYLEDVAVDGGLMHRELGFAPRWTLNAGWRDAIGEMMRCGDGGDRARRGVET